MGSAHVVGNVFCETDGLDLLVGKVASANEAAAKVEEHLGGP